MLNNTIARVPARATSRAEFWESRSMIVQALVTRAHRPPNFNGNVVCKYWLKDRCAAAEACPWLHVYDFYKIPVCGYIEKRQPCPDGELCVYRHTKI